MRGLILKLNLPVSESQVPPSWEEDVLILWREDECLRNDPSAEHIPQAWERHVGRPWSDRERMQLAEFDGGDCALRLYAGGWVVADSFDGSHLGRLVSVTPRRKGTV